MFHISLKDAILKIYLVMVKKKVTFSPLEFGQKGPTSNIVIRELLFNMIKNCKQAAKLKKILW